MDNGELFALFTLVYCCWLVLQMTGGSTPEQNRLYLFGRTGATKHQERVLVLFFLAYIDFLGVIPSNPNDSIPVEPPTLSGLISVDGTKKTFREWLQFNQIEEKEKEKEKEKGKGKSYHDFPFNVLVEKGIISSNYVVVYFGTVTPGQLKRWCS